MSYATSTPSFFLAIVGTNVDAAFHHVRQRGGVFGECDSLIACMERVGLVAEMRKGELNVTGIRTDGVDEEQYRFLSDLAPWVDGHVVYRYEDAGFGHIVFENGVAHAFGQVRSVMDPGARPSEGTANPTRPFAAMTPDERRSDISFWKAATEALASTLLRVARELGLRKSVRETDARKLIDALETARDWLGAGDPFFSAESLPSIDSEMGVSSAAATRLVAEIRQKWGLGHQ